VKEDGFLARLGRVVMRLSPYIGRHRRYLIFGTIGTLFVVACRLLYSWPLRGVLESAFDKPSRVADLVPAGADPIVWLGGAFLALVLIQGVAELVQRVSFARFSIGLTRDVRAESLAGIARGPAPTGSDAGDMIARIIGDSARFKSGLKGVLIRLTQNGTFFVGVGVALMIMDWELGVVFLVGGSLILVVAGVGASRVNRVARRLRKKEGDLAGRMHAALAGDVEQMVMLDDSERRAAQVEAKTTRMEGLTILCVHALLGVTVVSVLALGLHAVHTGRLEAADLFTVLFYLIQVHNPTVRLGRQAMRVGRVLASAERLLKLMDRPPPSPIAHREPDDLFAAWSER
jgi:ABC-type multidrug transport system fused ATPase/permease subunit